MLSKTKLKVGIYRGVLLLNAKDTTELPFNFEIKRVGKKINFIIHNGDERINAEELKQQGDSLTVQLPIFDTEFKLQLLENGNMKGLWVNHYRKEKNTIPFMAYYNVSQRFINTTPQIPYENFEGRWETTFSPQTPDSSKAIGVFHHHEQTQFVTGTFLTETGDYRFLEGEANGNTLYLSCFDGSHAFLFKAIKQPNGSLKGSFYSGAHWHETWTAVKNSSFQLRNAESLTSLKVPSAAVQFSFPDLNGHLISLNDKRFEGKPVIVQLMGSWCPNCMDESAYLSKLYQQYRTQGLELMALAYEKTTDSHKAKQQVSRLVQRFQIQYPILLTGLSGKDKASESLPFLNKVSAFPTTLFLNRKHEVVKIHTGFSGPATGQDYEAFKENTERLINRLLQE